MYLTDTSEWMAKNDNLTLQRHRARLILTAFLLTSIESGFKNARLSNAARDV
jgi:hypothetical protein